jgi:hypothetical protein
VKVGPRATGRVEVVEGVREGEQVLGPGPPVREGQAVRVRAAPRVPA